MAFSYMEVDTSQLKTDLDELRSGMDQAQKGLNDFKSEMDELNVMWKGNANLVFQSQIQEDYERMLELLKTVKKLADSMENAKNEYEKCENAVQSLVNGVRV